MVSNRPKIVLTHPIKLKTHPTVICIHQMKMQIPYAFQKIKGFNVQFEYQYVVVQRTLSGVMATFGYLQCSIRISTMLRNLIDSLTHVRQKAVDREQKAVDRGQRSYKAH